MVSSADDLRDALTARGITTVLIGAHAANRYRLEARHTVDVDLLASTLDGAADTLRGLGCVVRVVTDGGRPRHRAGRPRPLVDTHPRLTGATPSTGFRHGR